MTNVSGPEHPATLRPMEAYGLARSKEKSGLPEDQECALETLMAAWVEYEETLNEQDTK